MGLKEKLLNKHTCYLRYVNKDCSSRQTKSNIDDENNNIKVKERMIRQKEV